MPRSMSNREHEVQVAMASDFPKGDLTLHFHCLHDMGDPVGAARHVPDAEARR